MPPLAELSPVDMLSPVDIKTYRSIGVDCAISTGCQVRVGFSGFRQGVEDHRLILRAEHASDLLPIETLTSPLSWVPFSRMLVRVGSPAAAMSFERDCAGWCAWPLVVMLARRVGGLVFASCCVHPA